MIPARLKTGLWIIPLVVALGCVRSEHPLADEKSSIVDVDLIGEWRYKDSNQAAAIQIQRKPGSETVLQLVDGDERIDLLLTKIGDKRYFSVVEAEESPKYWILRYDFHGKDEVEIYMLNQDAIHDAVANRQLAGTSWYLFGKQAIISANPKELRAYLQKHGDDCFEPNLVIQRIKKDGN